MPIIVRLNGGLCNQIFQYAFARALAHRKKTDFYLDITPFGNYYIHDPYGLSPFNIKENIAKESAMGGFVWFRKHAKIFDFIYHRLRLKKILHPWYFVEKTMLHDPDVLSSTATYYEGFWQTEKYFKDIANDLRKELTLKEGLSPESQKVSLHISSVNSVSLHVRRYAHENIKPWHGFCTAEYYLEAINQIASRTPSPHFFIFSDNIPWLKENLLATLMKTGHPFTIVENNSTKNYEDLILMSKCNHHIIANSSFSWWGAWLNPKTDKIVLAPKTWFAHAPKNNTMDILPEEWIKI